MRESKRILIVEDQPSLAEMLSYNLQAAGYSPAVASTGKTALKLAASIKPDLILLDLMLPEIPGTELAARWRADPVLAGTPIIMVTAKADEVDQVVGLSLGADDYVTKPFSMKVLLARIEAVLRRGSETARSAEGALTLGPITIDTGVHEVRVDGRAIKLTLTEFRLLSSLVEAGGRVLSRRVLMAKAMGPGVTVTERTIDVHMTSIRKKLGAHGGILRTVRGVGYRATLEPQAAEV